MTFLAPGFLLAAAAIAGLTVALHFVVTRQPPSASLPTARFIPATSATIVTAARRPDDLLLLLVRVAVIALVGAAFARPHLAPHRSPVVRIVVADRSRDVADIGSVRDSVRRLLRDGDVLVVFDSTAHLVPSAHAIDTVMSLHRRGGRGSVSSALIVARRTASDWQDRADSLELDLVSPLAGDEIDASTPAVRALWGGRIRVVPVIAARDSVTPSTITVRGASDDPLRVAGPVAAHGLRGTSGAADTTDVRLVRDQATAADSAWTRSGHDRVLVVWPAVGRTLPWTPRQPVDTVGAVVVFRPTAGAVVAAFPRVWRLDGGVGVQVRARWIDGEPAIVEHALGFGCVRNVAIGVPAAGDLVFRPEMARLIATVLRPCGEAWEPVLPTEPSDVTMLQGAGSLLATRDIEPAQGADAPIVPWVFAGALLLVAVEVLARGRRPRRATPPLAPAGHA
jgi:hypothetical protein